MNTKVSVIVPVYNAEKFLPETIESVLKQTYIHFDLILINDGSKDQSLSICEAYAQKDSRVQVFSQSNSGVSAARNLGIQKATGEYICFLDADDLLESEYLSSLIDVIEKEQTDIVFTGHKFMYSDLRMVNKEARLREGKYTTDSLKRIAIDDGTLSGILFGSVWAAIYKTALIKISGTLFQKGIKKNEDGIFNLQLLSCTDAVYYYDAHKYIYRQWKNAVKKSGWNWDYELSKASDYIQAHFGAFPDADLQMKRRYVSVVFWNLLNVQNLDCPIRETVKQMKPYLEDRFFACAKEINSKKIGIYKKVFLFCLRHRQLFLFVFLLRKVKPILERLLTH